jgi:hypothetical protein
MYLKKVKSKKMDKKVFYVDVLKVTDERAGSGAGSDSKRYGSADPDPYQNVTDPEHCILLRRAYFFRSDTAPKRGRDSSAGIREEAEFSVICILNF